MHDIVCNVSIFVPLDVCTCMCVVCATFFIWYLVSDVYFNCLSLVNLQHHRLTKMPSLMGIASGKLIHFCTLQT